MKKDFTATDSKGKAFRFSFTGFTADVEAVWGDRHACKCLQVKVFDGEKPAGCIYVKNRSPRVAIAKQFFSESGRLPEGYDTAYIFAPDGTMCALGGSGCSYYPEYLWG